MQKGHCLCGDVQYQFDEKRAGFGLHCHCKDCQRVTGSGKATVILFPMDAVTIEGEYKTYASLGFDGSHVNRGFCPNCGSQMFTHIDEMPGFVFVKAGSLNDSSWVKASLNCWESTASPWSPVDGQLPGAERNPDL